MKILIVEDNPDILKIETIAIRKDHPDVEIITAMDGKSALKEFDRNNPDIVLLDHRLPDMPGLEVARTLRKNGYRKKIVAVTACAMQN